MFLKIIQGHRSLAGSRAYERTSAEQNCAVTKVIKTQHAMFSDESTPGPSTRNQLEDDVKPDITESNKENLKPFSGQLGDNAKPDERKGSLNSSNMFSGSYRTV